MKRVLRRILRGIAWLAGLALAGGAAIYILALMALNDMEQQPSVALPGSLSNIPSVVPGNTGTVLVWSGIAPLTGSNGHAAPVVSASLVENGSTLITTAVDGSARLTDLDARTRITAVTAPRLSAALYDRLWKPYGAPVAQGALWLAAQVLPLHIPESRKGKRGRVFRDCPDCPEMVEIGPGSVFLGSPIAEWGTLTTEGPRSLVQIEQPFAIGKFEVTFEQWDACVAAGSCKQSPSDRGWGHGRQPVINVSWNDIQEFTAWLSAKSKHTYRLPAEAEWEYAARAGATSSFWWGDATPLGKENFNGEFKDTGAGFARVGNNMRTVQTGRFRPNSFGLHDIHGNVAEWTSNCWSDRLGDKAPKQDEADCRVRTIRGGSWSSNADVLRAAYRSYGLVDIRHASLGFRLARTLNP